MSMESRKKKLQEAGKSHFLLTFSRLSRQPAWKEDDTGPGPTGSARGKRERDSCPGPPVPQAHPAITEVHGLE